MNTNDMVLAVDYSSKTGHTAVAVSRVVDAASGAMEIVDVQLFQDRMGFSSMDIVVHKPAGSRARRPIDAGWNLHPAQRRLLEAAEKFGFFAEQQKRERDAVDRGCWYEEALELERRRLNTLAPLAALAFKTMATAEAIAPRFPITHGPQRKGRGGKVKRW